MRTILLSLLAVATLSPFSSAVSLEKPIDGFNRVQGLDAPFPEKNDFLKKIKPPEKPPGPNLFPEAQSFPFLWETPTKMFPKINAFRQENDRQRKKHLFKKYYHSDPFHKESKKAFDSFQEDAKKPHDPKKILE